jgi:hypothetical protein
MLSLSTVSPTGRTSTTVTPSLLPPTTAIRTPGTSSAAATAAAAWSSGTSTSIGVSTPSPTPPCSSPCSVSKAGPLLVNDSEFDWPIFNPNTGAMISESTRTATPAAIQRRRTMSRAHAVQPRAATASCRIRGQSTRGPIRDSIAGSRVSTTATLTSGMSMPPSPMLRRNGTGTRISASRLIATVTPEASTAWPAVCMAITTASSFECPCARSSRQRDTSSSE